MALPSHNIPRRRESKVQEDIGVGRGESIPYCAILLVIFVNEIGVLGPRPKLLTFHVSIWPSEATVMVKAETGDLVHGWGTV
jgi:hypothetical protein